MNLCCIGVIVYDVGDYFSVKWGKSDQTLHLLKNISFYAFAISYPLISLCSKLRSVLVENVPFLAWASTLNARYLIKRAQYLGLPEKGLPGKLFLFLCSVLPLLVTFYRAFIYLYISECPFTSQETFRIVRDVYFLETLGCFVYIIYLIRISFQHQFSLLLSYIKEEEGHLDKCRGALFNVTTDFSCFKQFCSNYLLCTIPMAVLAISSSVAWQYTVNSTCSSASNERVLDVENNICRYVWLVFLLYLAVLTFAIGGLSTEHIWDNFYDDVLQLQSESHCEFWDSFVHQLSLLYKTKDNLTVTLFFSVLSCFTALQLGDQDVSFLANACNETFVNITSHYCF
ncbi:hypothetical protein HOLleu_18063 [Holothuria leucospilota]|uniref:Uncharacterized protein n=1 Tax=Holothuria leucospilota TaxID=206669 RepID=A0A9Q1C2Y8_HOLLE|nr:hypothetical protein HOLleu_18063 [Holothuria leucospilota]